MRARTGLILGFSLLGMSVAFAQSIGIRSPGGPANPSVPPSLSPDSRLTGSAPVGHSQPRRDAVPSDNPYAESAEDRALDRKIKSICKGC